jgi:hypothetical protein
MTDVAAEDVLSRVAGDGAKRRSRFVLNPTTGALELPADLRLKVENALRTEAYRLQLRLYFHLPSLYLRKLGLQVRSAALKLLCKLAGNPFQFPANRHRQSS